MREICVVYKFILSAIFSIIIKISFYVNVKSIFQPDLLNQSWLNGTAQ